MSEIHAALVSALSDLTVVEKGNTAKIPTKDGGSYSYSYADLPDVVRLTRPALAAQGLVALTPIVEGPAVRVLIVHTSGETLDLGAFPFPPGRDAQATGSAVTYHRRYALLAALGIAADDDDDGQKATASARAPRGRSSMPELEEARNLAQSIDDAADVVPEVVERTTGRKAKLSELSAEELSLVIPALRHAVAAQYDPEWGT